MNLPGKYFMRHFLLSILLLFFISGFSQKIDTDLTYSVNPSKAKSNPPVLIFLHGYGSTESDLFELSKKLDDRFLTFSIRAPFNGAEVGYSWYELRFKPNKEITCNYAEAKESRKKLLSFISHACKAYKADSTRVYLLGFSQGAIMAYDLALNAPKKIAGILALSGRLLEETKAEKPDMTAVAKVKFFIAHGKSDNIIDIKEAEKANEYLTGNAVKEVSYKSYEMPHTLNGAELIDINAWLKKALGPDKKPK
jgi:phospholipase/carboxylesterase